MARSPRRTAFVLAASDHGTMIVNRLDYCGPVQGPAFGVGYEILEFGAHARPEVLELLQLLGRRRAHFGDGVIAVDCGANIGSHTVEWAKHMTGWGSVIAIEAQERVFYALAGNVALNNCFNARVINAAAGRAPGTIRVPVPDYQAPGSFGSLEMRPSAQTEFIGQAIDYSEAGTVQVTCVTIDELGLKRLDLLKIDVEGMEAEVLEGAAASLSAFRPIVVAEHIKSGWDALASPLSALGYTLFRTQLNLIAIHPSDPTSSEVRSLN